MDVCFIIIIIIIIIIIGSTSTIRRISGLFIQQHTQHIFIKEAFLSILLI